MSLLARRGATVSRRKWTAICAVAGLWLCATWEGVAQPPAAPAAPAAAAPAPAAPAPTAPAAKGKESNFLEWYIEAEGRLFFFSQLALGIAIVSFIGVNAISSMRNRFINPAFVDQFDAMVKNRQYKEAFELAKVENNFLGKVMTAGLGRLTDGYSEALTAVEETGAAENMRNEHRLSVLSMLANISTLVGLLGTVVGMVSSFGVLATSDVAPPPSLLAKGVSQALVTTVTGLVSAIPAIMAFTILGNLNNKRLTEVSIAADNLLRPFKQISIARKPASAPAAPAAAAPTPAAAAATAPAAASATAPAAASATAPAVGAAPPAK